MIDLNLHLHSASVKTKKKDGTTYIYDVIRQRFLVLQPEELVRQLVIHHLVSIGYPKEKIQVERGLSINGISRRFDIVAYDRAFKPYLLIECKSHKVNINQATFDQIARYNIELQAPYLMVTNGVQNYCCRLDHEQKLVDHLSSIPLYGER